MAAPIFHLSLFATPCSRGFPLYLVEAKSFAKSDAAYASNGFEIGGFVGLILGGLLADKLFKKNKGRLAWFALMGVAISAFFFKDLNQGGFWVVAAALSLVGFFVYIADSILSGTAAQDVGGAENTASATGIINGIGSFGGALSGIVPIWIQQNYGWDAVFKVFALFSIIAVVLLAPAALKKEITKS